MYDGIVNLEIAAESPLYVRCGRPLVSHVDIREAKRKLCTHQILCNRSGFTALLRVV